MATATGGGGRRRREGRTRRTRRTRRVAAVSSTCQPATSGRSRRARMSVAHERQRDRPYGASSPTPAATTAAAATVTAAALGRGGRRDVGGLGRRSSGRVQRARRIVGLHSSLSEFDGKATPPPGAARGASSPARRSLTDHPMPHASDAMSVRSRLALDRSSRPSDHRGDASPSTAASDSADRSVALAPHPIRARPR